MKKHTLAAVVNFCTNESRFLTCCLEQASLFSLQVIVPVCDHFFDGVPENRSLLEEIYQAFPQCLFVEYPFVPDQIPKKVFKKVAPAHFWHSLSRFLATRFLREEIENVLFLDVDEIPDGVRFAEWLDCSDYTFHTVLKLASYWYFREARYRADKWEDSAVLVQKRALNPLLLLSQEERNALYDSLPGPKRRLVLGVDGCPMFHHYSWVRTEEEMIKKVRSWGHRKDRDWESLVKKEFSKPFEGVDFVHNYRFETVNPSFAIDFEPPRYLPKGKGNVIRMSEAAVVKAVKKVFQWDFLSLFSRKTQWDQNR